MRTENQTPKPEATKSGKPFSYRPARHLAPRFYDVVTVSKRSKASLIHEFMDRGLPGLEDRWAADLKKLRRARQLQSNGKKEAQAA